MSLLEAMLQCAIRFTFGMVRGRQFRHAPFPLFPLRSPGRPGRHPHLRLPPASPRGTWNRPPRFPRWPESQDLLHHENKTYALHVKPYFRLCSFKSVKIWAK